MSSKLTQKPELTVGSMYRELSRSWGPQHWWPAETSFEVVVGAILTQNTSWVNVERALGNLRAVGVLNIAGIRALSLSALQELVRPSGYYHQKAERLKLIVDFLDERYHGSIDEMFAVPTNQLRTELLALKGVGYETADAILLYAGNHEILVVDAYTRRIMERHAVISKKATYDEIRLLMQSALQGEQSKTASSVRHDKLLVPRIHSPSVMSRSKRSRLAQVYNEMHGLVVQTGKYYCLKQEPRCHECPLRDFLPPSGPLL